MINSAEEFYRLRTSENNEDYLRAAWCEAPLDVWKEIVREYKDMHFWVAQNKTVPNEILEELTDSQEWRVRHMIASKNKITELMQKKLANDQEALVRGSIVRNKKVKLSVLELLINDDDEEIRSIAKERILKGEYKE